jgi:hypothetical protein
MTHPHDQALKLFNQRLTRLLMLRQAVQALTGMLFVWGAIVLATRIAGFGNGSWLLLGILLAIPVAFIAALFAQKNRPASHHVRASYDRLNECGGIMMSAEAADTSAWQNLISPAAVPELQWRSGRTMIFFCVAAAFAATAILLPERLTRLGTHPSLDIGQIVEQLQAEVQTLTQEKIVDGKKSDDLQKQLSQLQKDASGYDPNKTWEALDHIKQSNSEAAKQAAEEALKKTESLTEAETLAKAMQQATESGMNEATASTAAQALAAMLNEAKLEAGILNGKIPPELLANLSGLDKEQMEKLVKALELNKNALSNTMSNLAGLKMIDAATLAKMQNAMKCPKGDGLADYLSKCKGGNCKSELLFSWLARTGRGGPGGGGPDADMTWDNNTSEDNTKFQEHTLPPASNLSDAQLVGVSKSAPELAKADAVAAHGALDNAAASGGSAHAQTILPEHRQAVQTFFKRDGK